jgi:hypothetical protein
MLRGHIQNNWGESGSADPTQDSAACDNCESIKPAKPSANVSSRQPVEQFVEIFTQGRNHGLTKLAIRRFDWTRQTQHQVQRRQFCAAMAKQLTRNTLAAIARYRQRSISFGDYQPQTRRLCASGAEMKMEQIAAQHATLSENACVLSRLQQAMLRTEAKFISYHTATTRSR